MNRKTNLIPALLLSALSLYAMEDVKVTQFQHDRPVHGQQADPSGQPQRKRQAFRGKESIKSDLTVRANACERHGTRR